MKLVHMCLAGFLLGYVVVIICSSPTLRVSALIVAAVVRRRTVALCHRLRNKRLKAFEEISRIRWSSSRDPCVPATHSRYRSK